MIARLKARLRTGRNTANWLGSRQFAPNMLAPWFAENISLRSIVRWDSWHELNQYRDLRCGNLAPPELDQISTTRAQKAGSIDLRSISGFGASKGPIERLGDLSSLAIRLRDDALEPTMANLDRLLGHDEIRVSIDGDGRNGDHIHQFGWEPGYWVANYGGSHHLAAAIVVAREIGAHVRVTAPIRHHSLNACGSIGFAGYWHSFLIPYDDLSDMCEALDADQCYFAVTCAPDPFPGYFAVHFERCDARARRMCAMFEPQFVDLSLALRSTLARQESLAQDRGW